MNGLRSFWGKQVDNSPLILFRMGFGFLAMAESWGAIMTGWVRKTLVEPQFTFNFIGFDWLQVLQGQPMYAYYVIMGLAGVGIMLGFRYRLSCFLFFLFWTGCYLMQKTAYNNHYYLLMLLSAIMIFVPAHKARSLDVRFGWVKQENTCANAYISFFIIHLTIVYLFASFNKIYPGWLNAEPIQLWFGAKRKLFLIGPLLTERWFQYFIAYGGIVYDGLIVFILLNARTRKFGFFLSLFFNLFISAVFQIGIFPYLMILWNVFFYPGETIRKIFFKRKPVVETQEAQFPVSYTWLFVLYFGVQIILPLRHWWIPGDVNWTEEGHRMSWRMMLRAKNGHGSFTAVNDQTGQSEVVKLRDHLTAKQVRSVTRNPDMAWQFARYLKKYYREMGWSEVKVYANLKSSLNGSEFRQVIDPEVDLASAKRSFFSHSEWIVTPNYENRPKK